MDCTHDFIHAAWATVAVATGLLGYVAGYLACAKRAKREIRRSRIDSNIFGTMAAYGADTLN